MMAYEGNRIAEGLDRAAMRVTGRQAHTGLIGPKMKIFAALVFMALSCMGFYLAAIGEEVGQGIVFAAAMASLAIKLSSDYKARGNGPLDERERAIYWKANAIGAMIPLLAVAIWTLNIGSIDSIDIWRPREDFQWVAVTFLLLGLMTQIGIVVTGWLTPSYAADLDEND